jgi:hypothetical protein
MVFIDSGFIYRIELRLTLFRLHLAEEGSERLWSALLDALTAESLYIPQDILAEANHTPDGLVWEQPLDILDLV